MLKYQKILIIISILFAVIGTFYGYTIFENSLRKMEAEQYLMMPIANKDIDALKRIEVEDISYVKIPKDMAMKISVFMDTDNIIGQYTTHTINKNSPFTGSSILKKELEVPFHLPENYRAITIESSPVISIGGYVKEGMYVDVIWTVENNGEKITVIALQNIMVLAIGSYETKVISSTEVAKTITLMMKPEEAQELTFMVNTGSLKLMLRPSSIEPTIDIPPTNLNNLINSNRW